MNRHYDKYLTAKYQPLYKNRFAPMNSTAMCWGFEVGDGWFNLINQLSSQLCFKWLSAKKHYETIKDREGELLYKGYPESEYNYHITIDHINKAKRDMEEEYNKVPTASQVKEKFGGLRFYVEGATDEQYELITFAENMSYTICDICGSVGKPNKRGWIATRCKDHRNE